MATFYLIRHGKPDYTYGDTHGFIGQGHDFAPLKQDRIKDVVETSKDSRLKNAQIIVASPYTRALQTASIISKETDQMKYQIFICLFKHCIDFMNGYAYLDSDF